MSQDEKIEVAYRRAKHTLGLKAVDHDCPVFREEFGSQLNRVLVEDTLADMQEDGTARVADVDRNGERLWTLA